MKRGWGEVKDLRWVRTWKIYWEAETRKSGVKKTEMRTLKENNWRDKVKGRRRQKEVRGRWEGKEGVNLITNVRDPR